MSSLGIDRKGEIVVFISSQRGLNFEMRLSVCSGTALRILRICISHAVAQLRDMYYITAVCSDRFDSYAASACTRERQVSEFREERFYAISNM